MTCSPRTRRRWLCCAADVLRHAADHAPTIPGTVCCALTGGAQGWPRSKGILSWDTTERRQTATASGVGHEPVAHSSALISARREASGLKRAFLVSHCSPQWRPRPHPSPASRQAACSRPGTGSRPERPLNCCHNGIQLPFSGCPSRGFRPILLLAWHAKLLRDRCTLGKQRSDRETV